MLNNIQCENNIPVSTWKHHSSICHIDFTRTGVILWFSIDVYGFTNLVWTSYLVLSHSWVECAFNLQLYSQSLCVTEVKTSLRVGLMVDFIGFTSGCQKIYEKMINLCSLYLTRCLLLLKTCTSCYLSWDRLINVPVINRVLSLSCPWEDLSTYPLKINIPDQWNTQTSYPRFHTSRLMWK